MAVDEKQINKKISKNFQRWVDANPQATLKRRIQFFDTLADMEYGLADVPVVKVIKPKPQEERRKVKKV